MFITEKIDLTKKNDGTVVISVNGAEVGRFDITTDNWDRVYNSLKTVSAPNRETRLNDLFNGGFLTEGQATLFGLGTSSATAEPTVVETLSAKEYIARGLTSLMNFFKEFEFEPNFRFVNTLSYKIAESKKSAKEYINNYFALMDNGYKNEIAEKIKSKEFDNILKDLGEGGKPSRHINERFKVYYGSAGTGKTTLAMTESDNRCIVCNASMLPSDLMEDFVFTSGQPTFTPSVLWDCMTEGKPIVLDEINLLPFDSLRFLQGILDGKTEFDYKGKKVKIAEGFEVIGTMNLSIGGMVYGLPEPLVDRSADFRRFVLTPLQLAKAILNGEDD